jgi:hypothetical protein
MDGHAEASAFLDGPDWRWRRAQRLARGSPALAVLLLQDTDAITRDAAGYILACDKGPKEKAKAERAFPMIAAAQALWDNAATNAQLRILVMGNCTVDSIAQSCAMSAEVIGIFEHLFFAVRESREARTWIACHVTLPEILAGNYPLATRLKLAYACGPIMTEVIIDDDCRLPLEVGERLCQRERRMHLKLDQALSMPIGGPREANRFSKLCLEWDLGTQRLRLQEQKFHESCKEAERRHQAAEVRMEHQLKRDAEKQAARERQQRFKDDEKYYTEKIATERRDAERAEEQVRRQRAAASPLAALRFKRSNGTVQNTNAGSPDAAVNFDLTELGVLATGSHPADLTSSLSASEPTAAGTAMTIPLPSSYSGKEALGTRSPVAQLDPESCLNEAGTKSVQPANDPGETAAAYGSEDAESIAVAGKVAPMATAG